MVNKTTIIKCGWILTQNDSREIFSPGYIVFEGRKITYVGEKIPAQSQGQDNNVIDASNMMAVPGLINSHGHTGMTPLRGMADDMPLMKWLEQKVWPMERQLTQKDIYWGAKLAMVEMIRSGTTCFNDMYWHNDRIAQAAIETGMRATIAGAMIENSAGDRMLENAKEFFNTWNDHPSGLIKCMFGPHAIYTCSKPFLEKVAREANDLGSPVHIHLAETEKELKDCKDEHGGLTPVEYLLETGIMENEVTAAHCIYLSENDMNIIKEKSVVPVHNPSSNMKLASGIMPVESLLEKGIPVALGTDSAVSNNNLSIIQEMKIASLLQKVCKGRADALPAETTFDMATRNGAAATGRRCKIGSLEPGYFADIVLFRTSASHTTPFTHPVSHLVYSMYPSDVDMVIINGDTVFSGGEFVHIDENEIKEKVNEIARRVKI